MAAASLFVSRSILSRQATITTRRLLPTTSSFFLTPPKPTAVQNLSRTSSNFFSTSPDYTNYETWHKDNYEDAEQHNNILDNTNLSSSSLLPNQQEALNPEGPRTSVLMELTDRVGALHDVLRFL